MLRHLYYLVAVTKRNSSKTTLKNTDYRKIKYNFTVKDHRIIEYNLKTESEYSEL